MPRAEYAQPQGPQGRKPAVDAPAVKRVTTRKSKGDEMWQKKKNNAARKDNEEKEKKTLQSLQGLNKTPEGSIVALVDEDDKDAEDDSKGFLVMFKRNSQIMSDQ